MFTMEGIQQDLLVEQTVLVEELLAHSIVSDSDITYDGHYLEESYLRNWKSDEWEEWCDNQNIRDEYDSFAEYLEKYYRVEVKEYRSIDQWWLITDRMKRWLEELGTEAILDTEYGIWWGRTESCSLDQDDALRAILDAMQTKFG